VELVAALNAFLEGFFESPPVLCTNGFTQAENAFDEAIQVFSDFGLRVALYSEEGDDWLSWYCASFQLSALAA